MMTSHNAKRIQRARQAMDAYRKATPGTKPSDNSGQEWLADLLTDLRHYAAAKRLDFDQACETSSGHFQAETPGSATFDPDSKEA